MVGDTLERGGCWVDLGPRIDEAVEKRQEAPPSRNVEVVAAVERIAKGPTRKTLEQDHAELARPPDAARHRNRLGERRMPELHPLHSRRGC